MNLSWKLLPVAALFALAVALVSFPASIVQAHTISVPASVNLNTPTAITVTLDAGASQSVALSATTAIPNSVFFVGTPTVGNITGAVGGSGTSSINFTEDGTSVARTLNATFQCTQATTVTFFLFVNGVQQATNGVSTTTCGAGTIGTGALSITTYSTVLAQGAQGSYTASASPLVNGQYITITASPALATFQQPAITLQSGFSVPQDTVYGQNTATLTIIASNPGTRTISGTFSCTQQGSMTLTITMGQAIGQIGTTPAYSQSVICGTGLLTPTVGPASAVTIAASPTSVSCNGTAFVTVTVRNSLGGYVTDGTSVSLTTSMGSLSPTTATTLGGGVLAVFTAPNNQNGTATVQANAAGTATGSASITVNCNAATPTPAIPPTIYVPPPANIGTGTISPPNTGDAGLAETSSVWQLYAGIALIVMSAAGAAAVVRVRS